jgi:uncharacterized protein YceH (UPF0502 family)
MLRGPQTVGELRGRTERMYHFQNFEEVEATVQRLVERETGALVVQIPRQPGLKEPRYAHLLGGDIRESEIRLTSQTDPLEIRAENDKILKLEQEVQNLRNEVAELRQQLGEFKKQFE